MRCVTSYNVFHGHGIRDSLGAGFGRGGLSCDDRRGVSYVYPIHTVLQWTQKGFYLTISTAPKPPNALFRRVQVHDNTFRVEFVDGHWCGSASRAEDYIAKKEIRLEGLEKTNNKINDAL